PIECQRRFANSQSLKQWNVVSISWLHQGRTTVCLKHVAMAEHRSGGKSIMPLSKY
ncbi:hypothetical protein A2U01_0103800, partial [Trifolium medium]|nr:hypothetical protein [Trifolium medium]